MPALHSHPHHHSDRYHETQKSTWVSVWINFFLTVLQIVVGYFGRSQALMADGLHSLSDLLSDFLVLYANRESNRSADAAHPYGHARIETAATFILGVVLAGLGFALLWGAGAKLQDPSAIQPVHVATLYIAMLTLVSKELLYRYLMAVAKKLRSQLLAANAWHSRSDAASSLVVVVGIGGNLLGYRYLDLIAAVLVAFMIVHMGWKMAFQALSDLIDTALDEASVANIRATISSTPGVLGLHELRTRKMGDQALVDAHILVDPRISVSEGHHIAERARKRVLETHEVLDVMVHIDPEDDATATPSAHLPGRNELIAHLNAALPDGLPTPERIVLHYLDGKVEAELFMPEAFCAQPAQMARLRKELNQFVRDDPLFRSVRLEKTAH
ncbi:MAG: cation diffusion facilitator family transporter [Burkholderiales bacterium]|nr:cation diffusion facilitator family transporter [Burkholderiales bacterium]